MLRTLFLAALAVSTSAQTLSIQKPDRVGRIIENEFFIADLSHRVVQEKVEDAGTLRALTYKPFGVTFFRSRNRMHWAPNMQRPGAPGYKGIGTWHPVQEFREQEKGGVYTHYREGSLAEYPEVKIEAEYRFMADKPYFLFWSRMTVEKPLTLVLLRNNEMTMDSFFTHVAWPDRAGAHHVVTFDERRPLLEKEPIAPDAPWLAFVNLDKGYGYGVVQLEFKNSRPVKAGIGISDGRDNGKYWSRRMIGPDETPLQPGDQFEERNAYVLFRATKEDPLKEFLEWEKKIRAAWSAAR